MKALGLYGKKNNSFDQSNQLNSLWRLELQQLVPRKMKCVNAEAER